MARRPRKATPRDAAESRYLASRIQDARRRGYSNRIIADSFGINERTVRKIISGETSGKQIYKSHIEPVPKSANKSIVRLDLDIGKDASGNPVIRTINAKVPTLPSAKGGRETPTPFDVFRLPNLQEIADAEGKRMRRQYGGAATGIDTTDWCERSGCGHPGEVHFGPDPLTGKYPCDSCTCPDFLEPHIRISTIRPIVRRDASKKLYTVTGQLS